MFNKIVKNWHIGIASFLLCGNVLGGTYEDETLKEINMKARACEIMLEHLHYFPKDLPILYEPLMLEIQTILILSDKHYLYSYQ